MKDFFKAFLYAGQGIVSAVKSQRNLRIHITAAVYVTVFSFFYELSGTDYVLLMLTFSSVISAELINTAVEAAVDICSPEKNSLAKLAKDAAAGAVLVTAVFAVIVGLIMFLDFDVIKSIIAYYAGNIPALLGLFVSVILSVIFIVYPKKERK